VALFFHPQGEPMYFLFQCDNSDIYALSADNTGANLPTLQSATAWLVREEVDDARIRLHFTDCVDTLAHKGYCLFEKAELKRTG
jgi:hypothetical protein